MSKNFMMEAINLASANIKDGVGGPFGAVVVKNNKIIGRGQNQVISSNDPTAHAEIVAIRKACKNLGSYRLNGCELYTSCEPCPMCLGAIYWSRLDVVYYAANRKDASQIGFDDDFVYNEFAKSINERKIKMNCCLRNEALAVFKEWFSMDNKVLY